VEAVILTSAASGMLQMSPLNELRLAGQAKVDVSIHFTGERCFAEAVVAGETGSRQHFNRESPWRAEIERPRSVQPRGRVYLEAVGSQPLIDLVDMLLARLDEAHVEGRGYFTSSAVPLMRVSTKSLSSNNI